MSRAVALQRLGRASLLALLGLGCACCTGSIFTSKTAPPSLYLLRADLAGSAAAAAVGAVPPGAMAPRDAIVPADLTIRHPRVRGGLDTNRIAVLFADRRLDYFANARWSGPLDQVVQDLTLQAFTTGAQLRNVSADSSAFPAGFWLEIDVDAFQAEYAPMVSAPTVYVHLLARLGAVADRRILGSFDATSRQTSADNRLTAIVDAYERAADAALTSIVADTSRILGECSAMRNATACARSP